MNFFDDDPGFVEILKLYLEPKLFDHLRPTFSRLGALAGGRLDELAAIADRNPPTLLPRERRGRDVQTIEYHPAYREMQRIGFSDFALAAVSHRGGCLDWPRPLPHAAKYTLTFLFAQAEFGLYCPISMTDSAARVINRFASPELVECYVPGLTSTDMDRLMQGAMFMTEMGAGSDVGATATIAREEKGGWRLYGEKWFCSNVDAEVILTLARPEGAPEGTRGLGMFLLPKTLPDGTRNAYRIVRLKDKLGTRSMPSGEVILDGAVAYPVGELSRGFLQMVEMVNVSRLSNGVRSAGLMRRAWRDATCAARSREAFGKPIAELPLLRRQLEKIRLPGEQAISFYLFTADVLQRADEGDERASRLARLLTSLLKFRACRDARKVTGDAMEVRGGCGYIEDFVAPRLLRDAHLGSIWEGTSNVVALDAIQRAVGRLSAETLLRPAIEERFPAAASRKHPRAAELTAEAFQALRLASEFARGIAAGGKGTEHRVREAATALYRATAISLMAVEAACCRDEDIRETRSGRVATALADQKVGGRRSE
jgi:alkylation response protein AidB-like acyl-CoA dehydrogenase